MVHNPFSKTDPAPKMRRSAFDLSYEIKTTMDMGHLYPVMFDEVVPGDIFTIGCSDVIRFNPLVAPVMHEVNCYVHYFFIPYRLLDPYWEPFITGGRSGTSGLGGRDSTSLIRWPANALKAGSDPDDFASQSLADYMGLPMDMIRSKTVDELLQLQFDEAYESYPIDYPRRAYYLTYYNYYWDENLDTEASWQGMDGVSINWESLDLGIIMQRGWAKDYFTSALPSRQRGIAPAIGGGGGSGPITVPFTVDLSDVEVSADSSGDPDDRNPWAGSIPVWLHSVPTSATAYPQDYDGWENRDAWDVTNPRHFGPAWAAYSGNQRDGGTFDTGIPFYNIASWLQTTATGGMAQQYGSTKAFYGVEAAGGSTPSNSVAAMSIHPQKQYGATPRPPAHSFGFFAIPPGAPLGKINAGTTTGEITLDLMGSGAIDASSIRLMYQIQKWMERNERSGYRYTEFLRAHYGVWPKDERIQRPEYIGGAKFPIVISEVLQTSQTNETPQGNMAGHGLAVNGRHCGKYRVHEFGMILGIMSIMPVPAYEDCLSRQWVKPTHFDFYSPEFAHLDEQAIKNSELRWNGQADDDEIYGFIPRWDELRHKQNLVTGKMRLSHPTGFGFWHLGSHFQYGHTVGLNATMLHHDFGLTSLDGVKRILADTNEPAFLVSHCNHIKAVRPLPVMSTPSLVDHN